MVGCKGEGLVLTIPCTVTTGGGPNPDTLMEVAAAAAIYKWKTATEPQGSNSDTLRTAIRCMEALKGVLGDPMARMLTVMYDVATATPPNGGKVQGGGGGGTGKNITHDANGGKRNDVTKTVVGRQAASSSLSSELLEQVRSRLTSGFRVNSGFSLTS
jgi:hypothetical protein